MATDSPVSVIGLGQCGSSVTLELSTKVDLTAINPALGTLGDVEVGLKLEVTDVAGLLQALQRTASGLVKQARAAFGNGGQDARSLEHFEFYIADMNHHNSRYVELFKSDQVRAFRKRNSNKTFDEFMLEMEHLYPGVFTEEDKELFISPGLQGVKPLAFKKPVGEGVFLDGAGGLQYISEYLAAVDDELYGQIRKHENGTLVGIFAAGGGTGAGSSLGLLSKYKTLQGGYTLGLCVLPSAAEDEAIRRAGRFLCRYLSADPRKRFDTLMLFSNDTANKVAAQAIRSLPTGDVGTPAVAVSIASEIINAYLAEYLRFFSEINQPTSIPMSNKIWDPADGQVSLQGPSFIGLARTAPSEVFDARELFLRALSPLKADLTTASLQGSGISLGSAATGIFLSSLEERIRAALRGEHLDELPLAYRTIKNLRAFFFVASRSEELEKTRASQSITVFEDEVRDMLRLLTGGELSIDVASYEADVPSHGLLLIMSGAFSPYTYELILEFIRGAFFLGRESQFKKDFEPTVREILEQARGMQSDRESLDALRSQLKDRLEPLLTEVEQLPASEMAAIDSNEVRRTIVNENTFKSEFLIQKAAVLRALEWLGYSMMRPVGKVKSPWM